MIDPDVAIQVMEQMSSELRLASPQVKVEFKEIAASLADQYGDKSGYVNSIYDEFLCE